MGGELHEAMTVRAALEDESAHRKEAAEQLQAAAQQLKEQLAAQQAASSAFEAQMTHIRSELDSELERRDEAVAAAEAEAEGLRTELEAATMQLAGQEKQLESLGDASTSIQQLSQQLKAAQVRACTWAGDVGGYVLCECRCMYIPTPRPAPAPAICRLSGTAAPRSCANKLPMQPSCRSSWRRQPMTSPPSRWALVCG